MNIGIDWTLICVWNKKREEFDWRVIAFDGSEEYARREWSHKSQEVLWRMTQAFLLSCDAALLPYSPDEPAAPADGPNQQLRLF